MWFISPAVEQSKSFEEQYVETCIAEDRAALADPSNSVHQMWEYDAQVRWADPVDACS